MDSRIGRLSHRGQQLRPGPRTVPPMTTALYQVQRPSRSRFVTLRGLRHHVLEWGDTSLATPERPTVVMQHGWMDVAA